MDSRSLWSKTSIVIFMDEINKLRQTYPRKMKTGVGEIQFQLHQSKELGSMLESDDVLLNAFDLVLRVLHDNLMVLILNVSRVLNSFIHLTLLTEIKLTVLILLIRFIFDDL